MTRTEQNLRDAFAGESQANRKYLAFAQKAESEGFTQVAKLFRAAAEAEPIHAHNHLRELNGIQSTAKNLSEALAGESYEFQQMYPRMIEAAKIEGRQGALRSFTFANEVEKVHAALYEKAIENLGSGAFDGHVDYYVCRACGYTAEGEAPDECPVCKAKNQAFKKVV